MNNNDLLNKIFSDSEEKLLDGKGTDIDRLILVQKWVMERTIEAVTPAEPTLRDRATQAAPTISATAIAVAIMEILSHFGVRP